MLFAKTIIFMIIIIIQFAGGKEWDLELVSCSGYGKNGALSVLQVRDQLSIIFLLFTLMIYINFLSMVYGVHQMKYSYLKMYLEYIR